MRKVIASVAAAGVAAAVLAGCSDGSTSAPVTTLTPAPAGTTASASARGAMPLPPTSTLSTAQRDGLLYMAQEERMARDLYQRFAAEWGSQVFANIGEAEQRHLDEVRVLLARYGLADPNAGRAAGSLADPTLQRLHDQLATQGKTSLAAALEAGVTVEQRDIADLRAGLSGTLPADVRQVYGNLLAASERHLQAFQRQPAR